MLHVAVGDPPWNTGMAWVDAVDAFPDRASAEVDEIVRDSLLDLLESGYLFFFRYSDPEDEFRPRSAEEGLSREEVAAVLAAGRLAPDESGTGAAHNAMTTPTPPGARVVLADILGFRATDAGERRHAELTPDDYRIFGKSRRRWPAHCSRGGVRHRLSSRRCVKGKSVATLCQKRTRDECGTSAGQTPGVALSRSATRRAHSCARGSGIGRPLRARSAMPWRAPGISAYVPSTPSARARSKPRRDDDADTPGIPGSQRSSE